MGWKPRPLDRTVTFEPVAGETRKMWEARVDGEHWVLVKDPPFPPWIAEPAWELRVNGEAVEWPDDLPHGWTVPGAD